MKTESLQYSNGRRECIEANRSTPTQRSLLISSPHIGASACPGHTIYSPIIEKWLGGAMHSIKFPIPGKLEKNFLWVSNMCIGRGNMSAWKNNQMPSCAKKLYPVNHVGSRSVPFSLEKALMHFWISNNLIQTYLQWEGRISDGLEAAFLWTVTWYVPTSKKWRMDQTISWKDKSCIEGNNFVGKI